jgi:hypothetical protein
LTVFGGNGREETTAAIESSFPSVTVDEAIFKTDSTMLELQFALGCLAEKNRLILEYHTTGPLVGR